MRPWEAAKTKANGLRKRWRVVEGLVGVTSAHAVLVSRRGNEVAVGVRLSAKVAPGWGGRLWQC